MTNNPEAKGNDMRTARRVWEETEGNAPFRGHRKVSIYMGPAILSVFAAIEDEGLTGFNRSGRLNDIAERYMAMIDEAMPEFTVNEWLAIFDANNGMASELPTAARADNNIWDYPHSKLGKKWGVDGKSLANRLQIMPLAARLAVAEAIERYWGGAYRIASPPDRPMPAEVEGTRKALLRAGARIKEEDKG